MKWTWKFLSSPTFSFLEKSEKKLGKALKAAEWMHKKVNRKWREWREKKKKRRMGNRESRSSSEHSRRISQTKLSGSMQNSKSIDFVRSRNRLQNEAKARVFSTTSMMLVRTCAKVDWSLRMSSWNMAYATRRVLFSALRSTHAIFIWSLRITQRLQSWPRRSIQSIEIDYGINY